MNEYGWHALVGMYYVVDVGCTNIPRFLALDYGKCYHILEWQDTRQNLHTIRELFSC